MTIKKQQNGFSLIEIMVTIAILAIIAALALPSYEQYILKTRRVDAANSLLKIQAEQEKFYFDNNTYMDTAAFATQNTNNGWFDTNGANVLSEGGFYVLTIAVNGTSFQDGFSATATPLAGNTQERDTKCTTLTINSSGVRTATGSHSDECWL